LILVLAAVPIAILTNAMRVSGTGVLAHYYGTRVADGFFHTFSGWVVYIAAFLLLFAVGWLLDKLNVLGRGGRRTDRTHVPAHEVKMEKAESASTSGAPAVTEVISAEGAK
jgi:hypothetical protein